MLALAMARSIEETMVGGRLVRDPPLAVRRLLVGRARPGEVLVGLLETATERLLGGDAARLWLALTDQRAIVLAALGLDEAFVLEVEPSEVRHKSRLGRDEVTAGELVLRCPLLTGGEFKAFARLAAQPPGARLAEAAELRLDEKTPAAALALAEAGLVLGEDAALLALRVRSLLALDRQDELGPALSDLVAADPELGTWDGLDGPLRGSPRALADLYRAAVRAGVARALRSRLEDLRASPPADPVLVELAIRMDADEGLLDEGLERASRWLESKAISAETFLACCETLAGAGLDGQAFHLKRASVLAELGRDEEALGAAEAALERGRDRPALRLASELLVGTGRTARARELLEELLGLGQDDAWLRASLATIHEADGLIDDAVEDREAALAHLLRSGAAGPELEREREALARLHRRAAADQPPGERDERLAFADVLEAGLDYGARLEPTPELVLSGSRLEAVVEVLAARPLEVGPQRARLCFEEMLLEGRAEAPPAELPVVVGRVAGRFPAPERERDGVHADRRGARARLGVGQPVPLDLPERMARGPHAAPVALEVPADVRPTYRDGKVLAAMWVEVLPLGARFPLEVGVRHEAGAAPVAAADKAAGKVPLAIEVADTAFSLGQVGAVRLRAPLVGARSPDAVEVALVATLRMSPPHKGERVVETLVWTFPVFPCELDRGAMDRELQLQLPDREKPSARWSWFELRWTLRVRLLRKDKAEAEAEVPVALRHPAQPSP